jgi:hypothetical protein
MENDFIYENIFNRCIFKKSTKEEMKSSIKFFSEQEDFEKCLVINELLKCDYYTEDDPVQNDLNKITKLINDHKTDLDDLNNISNKLTKKLDDNLNDNEIDDINSILDDIDTTSDDIIYNILESDKLRIEYFQNIYEEISNIEFPNIVNEKAKNLLLSYREKSINNLKKFIE